jgi:glycosyltransferase involved in cell wall biosynthesis
MIFTVTSVNFADGFIKSGLMPEREKAGNERKLLEYGLSMPVKDDRDESSPVEVQQKLYRQYIVRKSELTRKLFTRLRLQQQAILSSWRWKVGDRLVRFVERFLGRKASNLAIDQLEEDIRQLGLHLNDLFHCAPWPSDLRPALLSPLPGRSPKAWFETLTPEKPGLNLPLVDVQRDPQHLPVLKEGDGLKFTILLPSTNIHGGTIRLLLLASHLQQRGHQVRLFRQRPGPQPVWFDPGIWVADLYFDQDTDISDLERVFPDADVLLTYGNNAHNEKLSGLTSSKGRQYALFMHFGVHDRELDIRNARLKRVQPLATAQWIADALQHFREGDKVPCIGFGVATDRFYPESGQRTFRIGTLYDPAAWKRSELVMEAWRKLRKISGYEALRLVMFGQVETEFEEEGIDYFYNPPQSELRYLYSACSVWITASISEGIGMCSVEAMLCQTPLLTTMTGGSDEFCRPENCLLIDRASVPSIVKGVQYLLENPEKAASLVHQAYTDILEHDWASSVFRLESIISQTQADVR